MFLIFFFFNDTATTEIYTLSLHDALPISGGRLGFYGFGAAAHVAIQVARHWKVEVYAATRDRKSTRLNSSHGYISYAVFCLKKKKLTNAPIYTSEVLDCNGHCPVHHARVC